MLSGMDTEKRCPVCNGKVRPPQRILCGSAACSKIHKARVQREWQEKYRAEHGHSSTRKYENLPRYVASKAARAARRGPFNQREKYPEVWAAKDKRRKDRLKAATVEIFSREDIAERDGWVCHICYEPIDPDLKFPHRYSATYEHVVALYNGGLHSMDNCRLAHLRCNSSKKDRDLSYAQMRSLI